MATEEKGDVETTMPLAETAHTREEDDLREEVKILWNRIQHLNFS